LRQPLGAALATKEKGSNVTMNQDDNDPGGDDWIWKLEVEAMKKSTAAVKAIVASKLQKWRESTEKDGGG
jgi:LAS superfamily LD-carboxypeptidase LdcB